MTTYTAACAAIESRLRSNWGETDIVAFGERVERPSPPRPIVMFEVEADPSRIVSFGGGGYTTTDGRLILTIFVPVDGGRGLALEIAERLAAVFPVGLVLDGVRFRAPGFGRVLPADGDDGWLSCDLTLPWSMETEYAAAVA